MIRKLSDNTKVYIDRYFAIIDEMANTVRKIEVGGSISEIYIRQMVAMSQGLIDMGENILEYTTNANVETLAKNLIEEGESEIDSLNQMLEYCANCENEERDVLLYQRKFVSLFDNMLSKMNGVSVTNNLDLIFISGMIAYYEGTISIAKNALVYEICENLRKNIEEMLTTQEMQTNQMSRLLRIV